jgi:hypothetical protein
MKNEARHSLLVSVSLAGSKKRVGWMGGWNAHSYISHFPADFIISMSIFYSLIYEKACQVFFYIIAEYELRF